MNYMVEVAKILGVKLGEYFQITCNPGHYFLCNDGLVCDETGYMVNAVLNDILIGKLAIKRKPWKPEDDEMFFVVAYDGSIMTKYWDNEATMHRTYYKIGNCYRHFNEAKDYREKWIAFYASDEVLEV